MAKLKIVDILAKKESAKQKKLATRTLHVKSLDAEIVIQEPTRTLIMEAASMGDEQSDEHIVYHCVIDPNLKENHKELMDHFGCATPYEIVDHLFKPAEVSNIAKQIMDVAGYLDQSSVKVIDEVKN